MKQQQVAADQRITRDEVEMRTTLVRADGRVVERPDGNRLLVDAYNVLHRDYDALSQEYAALREENERLASSAATSSTATQEEFHGLTQRVSALQLETAKARDSISTVRTSLGDILARFFKEALTHVAGTDDVSEIESLFAPPDTSSPETALQAELKLLQQAKDTLIMTLTTAAAEHRRGETQLKTSGHSSAVLGVNLGESEARSDVVQEEHGAWCDITGLCMKDTSTLASTPKPTKVPKVPAARRDSASSSTGEKAPPTAPAGASKSQPNIPAAMSTTAVRYRHTVGAPSTAASPREKRNSDTMGSSHSASPSPTLLFPGRRDLSPGARLGEISAASTGSLQTVEPRRRTHSANTKKKSLTESRAQLREAESPRNLRRDGSTLDATVKEEDRDRRDSLPQVGVLLEVGGKVVATSTDAFHVGDIIMSGDGRTIITQQDLYSIISQSATGVVQCRVRRSGQNKTVEFKVKAPRPSTSDKNRKSKERHVLPSTAQRPKSKSTKK